MDTLLAYPVPGSQLSFGNFLVMASAVVCASDAVVWIGERLPIGALRYWRCVTGSSRLVGAVGVLVLLGMAGTALERRYEANRPLGHAGADRLRIGPERVRLYRELAASVEPADVVFVTMGLHSLSLWTGRPMPAPVLIPHDLRMLRREDRRAIMAGLSDARRPIVVYSRAMMGEIPSGRLIQWISQRFAPYRKIGPFFLMRPRSTVPGQSGAGVGAVTPKR